LRFIFAPPKPLIGFWLSYAQPERLMLAAFVMAVER
jgi:hypothetical protein